MSNFSKLLDLFYLLLDTENVNNEQRYGTEVKTVDGVNIEYNWIEIIFSSPLDFSESYVATVYGLKPGDVVKEELLESEDQLLFFGKLVGGDLEDMLMDEFFKAVELLDEQLKGQLNS